MLQRNRQQERHCTYLMLIASLCVSMMLTLGVAAQETSEALPDSVLVVVNDEPITTGQMDREFMAMHRRTDVTMDRDFAYDKLVTKLINDRLIVQEATAMGMADEDWLRDLVDQTTVHRAIQMYIRDHYDGMVLVSPDMMQRYFDSLYHRKQIRTVTVRTLAEANQVREQVLDGADMDSLAREISLDTYKFKGGLQNFNHWADIPVMFREVIVDMDSGEVSEPFPFREAFTILRLEREQPADPAEFPYFEGTIESRLKAELQELRWKHFVDSLKKHVAITYSDSVLDAIRSDSSILFTERFANYSSVPALSVPSGVTVTEGELRKEISHNAMSDATTPFDSIYAQNLSQAEQKAVLGETAMRLAYDDSAEVIAAARHTLDSALIEEYVKEQIVSKIRFSREEFQEYYDSHQNDFRASEQFQIFRATLTSEEAANQFVSRLKEGADFTYLKRQIGTDSLATDLSQEWVTLESFPDDVRADIKSLKIGQPSRPYATTTGWVVFELKDRRPGRLKTIEEVDMEIRQALFQQQFNSLMDEHLSILKEHSEIDYNQDAIDKYFRRGDEG